MISVAEQVDITCVKFAILVVGLESDDVTKVFEAVKGRSLLHDAAQDCEVIGI